MLIDAPMRRLPGNPLDAAVSAALGNFFREYKRFFRASPHLGNDAHDVWNNVAGLLENYRIANADI